MASILIFGGCNTNLKTEIKNYKGDGKIRYLKAPLLGIAGCAIEMEPFDLSKKLQVEYDFTGIPTGSNYRVFLIVPEPCPLQKVKKGVFGVQKAVWSNLDYCIM